MVKEVKIFSKLKEVQFSQRTEKYFSRRQAFASFQHGFIRSDEKFNLDNLSESV